MAVILNSLAGLIFLAGIAQLLLALGSIAIPFVPEISYLADHHLPFPVAMPEGQQV